MFSIFGKKQKWCKSAQSFDFENDIVHVRLIIFVTRMNFASDISIIISNLFPHIRAAYKNELNFKCQNEFVDTFKKKNETHKFNVKIENKIVVCTDARVLNLCLQ